VVVRLELREIDKIHSFVFFDKFKCFVEIDGNIFGDVTVFTPFVLLDVVCIVCEIKVFGGVYALVQVTLESQTASVWFLGVDVEARDDSSVRIHDKLYKKETESFQCAGINVRNLLMENLNSEIVDPGRKVLRIRQQSNKIEELGKSQGAGGAWRKAKDHLVYGVHIRVSIMNFCDCNTAFFDSRQCFVAYHPVGRKKKRGVLFYFCTIVFSKKSCL
jgi:hypothetical protein